MVLRGVLGGVVSIVDFLHKDKISANVFLHKSLGVELYNLLKNYIIFQHEERKVPKLEPITYIEMKHLSKKG